MVLHIDDVLYVPGLKKSVPIGDFSLSHLERGNKVTLALNDLRGAFNVTLEIKVTVDKF